MPCCAHAPPDRWTAKLERTLLQYRTISTTVPYDHRTIAWGKNTHQSRDRTDNTARQDHVGVSMTRSGSETFHESGSFDQARTTDSAMRRPSWDSGNIEAVYSWHSRFWKVYSRTMIFRCDSVSRLICPLQPMLEKSTLTCRRE